MLRNADNVPLPMATACCTLWHGMQSLTHIVCVSDSAPSCHSYHHSSKVKSAIIDLIWSMIYVPADFRTDGMSEYVAAADAAVGGANQTCR